MERMKKTKKIAAEEGLRLASPGGICIQEVAVPNQREFIVVDSVVLLAAASLAVKYSIDNWGRARTTGRLCHP